MTPYEKLTPALRQWVDQAVSRVPEEDRYQQRRELAEQTQALYEGFCAAGQAEQAEALTLGRLGSAVAAMEERRERAGQNRKKLARVSLVLAAVFLVIGLAGVYVNLTRRPSMGGHFLFGTGGMLGFSVIFLIASIAFFRSTRKR